MSERKLNIAIVVPSNLPIPSVRGGAIETLVDNLIYENEKQAKMNIIVYSKYDQDAKEKSKELKYTNIVYIKEDGLVARIYSHIRNFLVKLVHGNRAFSSYFLMEATKKINKLSMDFVIIEGNNIVTEYVKKRVRIPLILHLHNELNVNSFRAFEVGKSTDFVFSVSDYIRQKACTIKSIDPKHTYTIHNCTDIHVFNKNLYKKERFEIRKGFNIEDDDILLIFTGRIVKEKGLYELVEAVSRISSSKIKLMILGAASFDNRVATNYSKKVNDLVQKNENRIFFSGFVHHNEIAKYYAAADIAVIPSMWEEPGALTVFEALSTGIPIVATRSGGIVEYFNETCAIMIEKEPEIIVEELIKAIGKLAEDEDLRTKMGIAAREHMLKYGIDNYYKEYTDALEMCFKEIK